MPEYTVRLMARTTSASVSDDDRVARGLAANDEELGGVDYSLGSWTVQSEGYQVESWTVQSEGYRLGSLEVS